MGALVGNKLIDSELMTANITSSPMDISEGPRVSVQLWTTGGTAATGNIYIDYSNVGVDDGTWTTAVTIAVAAAAVLNFQDLETAALWMRVRYVRTGGGAVQRLNARAHVKKR